MGATPRDRAHAEIPVRVSFAAARIFHESQQSLTLASGVPPTTKPDGSQGYTLPAITLPDGTHISDSLAIAQWAEQSHSSPGLHLSNNLHLEAQRTVGQATFPIIPVFMPRIARSAILPSSVPWFLEARSKMFGMPLDELEKVRGGEGAWEAAKPGIEALGRLMREKKVDEGPFILGSQVCYADFVIVALLQGLRTIGQDLFDRFVGYAPELRTVWEACEPWLRKAD